MIHFHIFPQSDKTSPNTRFAHELSGHLHLHKLITASNFQDNILFTKLLEYNIYYITEYCWSVRDLTATSEATT